MSGAGVVRGLVLAGGKSRRMGRDKTRLEIDGRTLLERAVTLLREVAGEVHVSGADPSDLGCDAPWLPDDVPGLGPLGGILTALGRLGGPVLAMACDLPRMRADILRDLLRARDSRPDGVAATMFADAATGRAEPLVAVYEPEAAELLARASSQGRYGLSRAVPREFRLEVPYGPELAGAFLNLNTPGDLAELTGPAAPAATEAGA